MPDPKEPEKPGVVPAAPSAIPEGGRDDLLDAIRKGTALKKATKTPEKENLEKHTSQLGGLIGVLNAKPGVQAAIATGIKARRAESGMGDDDDDFESDEEDAKEKEDAKRAEEAKKAAATKVEAASAAPGTPALSPADPKPTATAVPTMLVDNTVAAAKPAATAVTSASTPPPAETNKSPTSAVNATVTPAQRHFTPPRAADAAKSSAANPQSAATAVPQKLVNNTAAAKPAATAPAVAAADALAVDSKIAAEINKISKYYDDYIKTIREGVIRLKKLPENSEKSKYITTLTGMIKDLENAKIAVTNSLENYSLSDLENYSIEKQKDLSEITTSFKNTIEKYITAFESYTTALAAAPPAATNATVSAAAAVPPKPPVKVDPLATTAAVAHASATSGPTVVGAAVPPPTTASDGIVGTTVAVDGNSNLDRKYVGDAAAVPAAGPPIVLSSTINKQKIENQLKSAIKYSNEAAEKVIKAKKDLKTKLDSSKETDKQALLSAMNIEIKKLEDQSNDANRALAALRLSAKNAGLDVDSITNTVRNSEMVGGQSRIIGQSTAAPSSMPVAEISSSAAAPQSTSSIAGKLAAAQDASTQQNKSADKLTGGNTSLTAVTIASNTSTDARTQGKMTAGLTEDEYKAGARVSEKKFIENMGKLKGGKSTIIQAEYHHKLENGKYEYAEEGTKNSSFKVKWENGASMERRFVQGEESHLEVKISANSTKEQIADALTANMAFNKQLELQTNFNMFLKIVEGANLADPKINIEQGSDECRIKFSKADLDEYEKLMTKANLTNEEKILKEKCSGEAFTVLMNALPAVLTAKTEPKRTGP